MTRGGGCRLAAKVGLQLYKKWTFHELFCEKVKTDQALYRLLFHMEAVDENGAISADEWEAASAYPSSLRSSSF